MNTTNTQQDVQTTQEGVWVPLRDITVPEDARPHTQEDVDSRAVSMAREGQEQNALLSKEGDKLVLIYGHGRLLSAQKLGWEKLRCDIKEGLTETQKLMLALAENAERENESPFYTALTYQKLMAANGWTQEQLATELGKELRTVKRYLSLAKAASEVQKKGHACHLALRQCLEIVKLTKVEDQLQVMEECATQDLAGKALEARVKQLLNLPAGQAGPAGSKSKEGKQAVEDTILECHYVFDGKEVAVKPRRFRMGKESVDEYLLDIKVSLTQFVTGVQCGAYQKPEVTQTA